MLTATTHAAALPVFTDAAGELYTSAAARQSTGDSMKRRGFISSLVVAIALSFLPGLSAAIEVGDKAPDFDLNSTQSGKFKLSNLAGKKNVIIQFYVLDFTPA